MGAHERHNMGKKAKKDKQVEQDDDAWMDQVMPLREELTKLQCIMDDAMAAAVLQHQKSAMPVYRKRNDILASVPGFWAKALGGHPMLHGIISEKDTEILQFCTRLDVDVPEIKPKIEGGESEQIVLTMSFEKNAFFSNTTLRKSVTSHSAEPMQDEDDEPDSFDVECDSIEWKEGHGPAKGGKKNKKRELEEEGSMFDVFDGEKYADDTLLEPLREVFMNAEEFFAGAGDMIMPEGFCDDDDDDE